MKRTLILLLICGFAHHGAAFADETEKRNAHPADILGTGLDRSAIEGANKQCSHREKTVRDDKIDATTQLQPFCPKCQDIKDLESLESARVLERKEQSDVTPQRDHDEVSLAYSRTAFRITVQHKRGIGFFRFALKPGDEWPITSLHFKNFKGLEGLSVTNGSRTICLHDEDGLPAGRHLEVKRKGEGFDVEVPSGFLQNDDKVIQVEWVDFYR